MPNFKILIEYDGFNYSGWQSQINAVSVQGQIEKAIHAFSGEKTIIYGAGRTDAGVHALAQCANFKINNKTDLYQILHGINFHLSKESIKIIDVEKVSDDFHARHNAHHKTYLYKILNRPVPSAIDFRHSLHVNKKINLALMQKGAETLIGTHDFSSFRASGCQAKTPIKTVDKIHITTNGDMISLEFEAKSFLYQQIRIMVGCLIDIGLEKQKYEWINELFKKKDRKLSGQTALPKGLFLKKVSY
ncbi:MAG: tRNA pseudouridine(38-40) synthase TruA [Alphaproteobacteria bacterium]|jgi:tRNA pseudouridine38-40 synthase|tara:strand:+ start:641 stop:1378 length:738 start_codon:yes stop_codon:yes gene_type:complete